jgi:hypothetical protein
MNPKEREKKLKLLAELKKKYEELKQADPFWFFVPNGGELTDERRAFLRRYLKEEDIPATIAGLR